MTTASELWDDGRRPALGPFTLIGEGFRLIGAHIVPVAVIFVLMIVLAYSALWATTRYAIATTPGLTAAWAGVALAGGVVGGILSGALLKALLGRPLAVDRGWLAYVGIVTAVGVVTGAVAKALAPAPPEAGDTAAAMAALGPQLVLLVLFLAWAFVAVKLMLWPIGVLVGDRDVTPRKSWQLTHRAFWGYILGLILLDLIPWCVLAFLGVQAARDGRPGDLGPLAAPLSALMGLCGTTLAAALYKLRREEPEV
jgi:hypothetical protein